MSTIRGHVFEGSELDLIQELDEVRTQMKKMKARERELRDEVLAVLDRQNAEQGLTASGSQLCKVTVQHRRSVNSSKLEALYPAIYLDVVEEKTATILNLG